MNETPQPTNVIPLSAAKGFGNSSAKAFSVMSTLQKVTKRGDSRAAHPSQGREHPRSRELRGSMPQMSLLDNEQPKASTGARLAQTELVKRIIKDVQQIKEVYGRYGHTGTVQGLDLVIEVLEEDYLD